MLDRLYVKMMNKLQEVVNDEQGDTNFISVLIILGIVVVLAGVFMTFKDQIVGQVNNIVSGFTIG
ncbi:MAG: hypothetical protein IK081_13315 [Lachnospiraceae bacterium]|nr:hypothetical protein [Lachnospiraceae bacterium]